MLCEKLYRNVLDLDIWLKAHEKVSQSDSELIRKAIAQISLYLSQYAFSTQNYHVCITVSKFISTDYDRSLALAFGLFGEGFPF
jgi:hypothetical protein